MNILLLTYQGDIAGSTNSIYYLATGLAARGHVVVVGLRPESLLYGMLQQHGSVGVVCEPMTFGGKLDVENMRQIADVVRRYNIKIINPQSSRDRYTAIFANWCYGLKAAVVHTRRQKPKSMGGFLQRWFYVKGTRSIITVSSELKNTFVRKGYPANHLKVIYNGLPAQHFAQIDEKRIADLRRQFGLLPTDTVIGCVSRLKNQAQLIAALPLLPPDIKVLFVGIAADSLDDIARQYGVKNQILYAGKVAPQEVLNYYKLFSLKVLPSTMDGFGLVLLEAMGLGVPVVATRSEGLIDVLDNEQNGLWFDDGNIRQLAEKINIALYDPPRRKQLIENGYKAAYETFSLEKTLDNYEHFFAELLNK